MTTASPREKIEYCHSGNGKKYAKIETSVNAFYQSGHIDHDDDIWPAFSFWKHGKLIEVAAQGDQSPAAVQGLRRARGHPGRRRPDVPRPVR